MKDNNRWMKANYTKGFLLPVESSCRPTSKDSLSVWDLDVFKQARYCGQQTQDKAVTHTHSSAEDVIYSLMTLKSFYCDNLVRIIF